MSKPLLGVAIPAITTAEIKDEMWLEVARYQAGVGQQRAALQAQLPTAEPGEESLQALLALDGLTFVDAAYRTILGRAADDAGIAYFMQAIADSTSKIVLLGELQRSKEAGQTGRRIPGLRRRYLAHRLYGVPVLGSGVRLVGTALRVGGVSGALGAVVRPQPVMRSQRVQVEEALEALEALEQRVDAQEAAFGAALDAAARRIAALQARQEEARDGSGKILALVEDLRCAMKQDDAAQHLPAAVASQARMLNDLVAQSLDFARRLTAVEDSSIESMLAMSDEQEDHRARLARLENLLNGEAVAMKIDDGAAALRQSLDERLSRTEVTVATNRQEVIDQERRISLILEAVRRRPELMPEALRVQDEHAIDDLYVAFEDRFRGTRSDIKERLRFYLPILAESQAGSTKRPVVDVGCGRGEFLELLRDEGLTGHGVDTNEAMVATCQALGLDCVAEDALAFLGRQPAGSLGAVTGFHIIEHLPFNTMVRLFDAALAALAPGGVMVFETPNPANLLVASRWFYLDPTHRNPLPGEMVAMIAEARGFCRVSIVEMHPMDQRFGGNDKVLREQLDQLFHGPQDYALLARKP
jgi:SAM-dependent methyltransferase